MGFVLAMLSRKPVLLHYMGLIPVCDSVTYNTESWYRIKENVFHNIYSIDVMENIFFIIFPSFV